MSNEETVQRTILATKSKSKNSSIESDITIALKEFDNNTYKVVIMIENAIVEIKKYKDLKKAEDSFLKYQIKYFGEIVQSINDNGGLT